MPKYELCYILSANVSDDQVPTVTEQIKKFITDFGGSDIKEEQLGKKKLAYPIKKTKNGFYVVDVFDMESKKINELDAKLRSQTATIIRHLLINLDEHLQRTEKDKVAQARLPKRPVEEPEAPQRKVFTPEAVVEEVKTEKAEPKPKVQINAEDLDKKIEEALMEKL